MITKWKNGVHTEPAGTQTDWLLRMCHIGQNGYNFSRQQALNGIPIPDEIDNHHAQVKAAKAVKEWSKKQKLISNDQKFKPFSGKPGLTISLLPSILSENRLRAVLGTCPLPELGDTAGAIEQMLRDHGPLYCLVGWGHVVVVVGITADNKLEVHDPQAHLPSIHGIDWVVNSPCVARIVSFL
jgi:hypothetical protein